MPYFIVYALDKPGMEDVRDAHRPAHRARLRDPEGQPIRVHIGGPLMDASGKMNGSMLVVEAPSQTEVKTFVAGDPYSIAGLYETVEIRHYNWGLGTPKEVLYG